MKYIILAIAVAVMITGIAYGQTYAPVTGDDEVETIGEVVIKETESVETETALTLAGIDQEIAVETAQIAYHESLLADLQAQRALVLKEAEKVKLKEKPAPVEL